MCIRFVPRGTSFKHNKAIGMCFYELDSYRAGGQWANMLQIFISFQLRHIFENKFPKIANISSGGICRSAIIYSSFFLKG